MWGRLDAWRERERVVALGPLCRLVVSSVQLRTPFASRPQPSPTPPCHLCDCPLSISSVSARVLGMLTRSRSIFGSTCPSAIFRPARAPPHYRGATRGPWPRWILLHQPLGLGACRRDSSSRRSSSASAASWWRCAAAGGTAPGGAGRGKHLSPPLGLQAGRGRPRRTRPRRGLGRRTRRSRRWRSDRCRATGTSLYFLRAGAGRGPAPRIRTWQRAAQTAPGSQHGSTCTEASR